MIITDTGIIIHSQKYSDSGLLVTIFSETHGIIKGMAKGQKKNQSIVQVGNKVSFEWNARLEEHLGTLNLQLEKAYSLLHFSDYLKILSISSATALLNKMFKEKEPMHILYKDLINYLDNLKNIEWLKNYALLELNLLTHSGFGFDLERCAVTDVRDNIIYISPKTASAVCAEVGEPYKDKLFSIPKFFSDKNYSPNLAEIIDAINITRYFISRNFFEDSNNSFPKASENFYLEILDTNGKREQRL